ncbi:Type 1 glutamine amidotransferase-like domain-containing protein [Shewanella pealeana]|uniref:Peptidase S51 dipeptidase E n=1 Tax=Shewanella pealeana (strain ATCC 700345 / ANG-SQ1) TaxID=398579 RepID=A8H2Y7_SHEPA|nr:Type 1 glutamine amidotransferase-like domain-containing protein [Shewanella pealeana]ABV86924.1 peptidase S51 dipeptidase E [Shewanella pealeana ATCC 700345]
MKLALLSDPNTENGQAAINALLQSLVSIKSQSPLKVGYIASQPDPQREYFQQTKMLYKTCGAELSVYLELEAGFSQHALDQLLDCDAIQLSGGDTYRFLKALKSRKLLPVLRQYAINGGALVGVSAGAMIMTPSIASASLCGDINNCELEDLNALNLVDFLFAPHIELHVSQEQPLSEPFQQQLARFSQQICLCPDDAALLSIDKELKQLGQCHWHLL